MAETATTNQALSKVLFNAQHRIAVASVFSSDGEVLGYEEVAQRSGASRSVVHKELGVLVRIRAVDRLDVGRTVQFQRREGPFWPLIDHLVTLDPT